MKATDREKMDKLTSPSPATDKPKRRRRRRRKLSGLEGGQLMSNGQVFIIKTQKRSNESGNQNEVSGYANSSLDESFSKKPKLDDSVNHNTEDFHEEGVENDDGGSHSIFSSSGPYESSSTMNQSEDYIQEPEDITTETLQEQDIIFSPQPQSFKKKPRQYQCPYCPYSTNEKRKLPLHLVKHTGEFPYKCTQEGCDYGAAKSENLRNHILKVHTSERPFRCEEPNCDFATHRKPCLTSHMATHTREKRFSCPYPGCDFTSSWNSSINSHVKSKHTLEKPFKCPECDHRSAEKNNLKRHIQAKHPGADEDAILTDPE